ncbi:MAG TPA: hypothetical protein VEY67_11460 [Candidatus Dormibacteraeota bacterium]|nr:hypothetical protein [Candidatus Dormibacteraeota bacterium]
MPAPTVADVIGRALDAYTSLVAVGEGVEDDWQYVTDLSMVWRGRLGAVSGSRGGEPLPPWSTEAVDAAIDEIGLIADPHRAIDWLSTFPQIVLAALGEPG